MDDAPDEVAFRNERMSVDAELRRLESGDASARQQAAERLGELKANRGVPQLTKALDDTSPYVCGWAAWALGEIGDPAAIDALIAAMDKYKNPKGPLAYKEAKRLPEIRGALKKLTGQDFGFDSMKWVEWNENRKLRS